MTEFAVSRTSLQHVQAFRLPRGLFRDLAGVSLPDLSRDSALCTAEAKRVLTTGIREAVLGEIDLHNAPKTTAGVRTRNVSSRRVPQPLPHSLKQEMKSTLEACLVQSGRVELQFSGATKDDALALWSAALGRLGLESRAQPSVQSGRPDSESAELICLRLEMPVDDGSAPVVGLTRGSYKTFGEQWNGTRRVQDGVLHDANGQAFQLSTHTLTRSQLSQLPTDGMFDFGLYLLEAWYSQRDHWARKEVRLPSGEIVPTPGQRVLVLDPAEMERRQRASEARPARNWRQKQWRRVQAAALAQESMVAARPPVIKGLLAECRDGRRPPSTDDIATSHATGLGAQKLPLVDAFFVVLDKSLVRTLFPLYDDSAGGLFWGAEALKQARRDARGDPDSQAAQSLEVLRKKMERFSYIRFDPDLMLVAEVEGWTADQKRLIVALMSEVTPPNPRKRRFTAKRPVEARAVPDGYSPYNGGAGAGYKLSTWLEKTCGRELTALDSSGNIVRAFLSDLLHLHHQLGLEVEIDGDGHNTVALLSQLKCITSNKRWPKNAILKIFLPDNLPERLGQLLRSRNIQPTRPFYVRAQPVFDQPSNQLRIARKQNGLSLEKLGQALGVSKAAISQWETGKRNIPTERRKTLEAIFSGLKDVNFASSRPG